MKNFFKKLSFVLAVAMVLTSIAPATAHAAADYIYKKGKDAAVEEVNVWFGDEATDLNVKINGKKNVAGTWKVGNKKIATIDENGVITPVKNGTTTVAFVAKTGEKVKATLVVGTRAKTVKPYLATDDTKAKVETLTMTVGEKVQINVGLGLSADAKAAGATKTSMKTAYTVDGTAVEVAKVSNQKYTIEAVEAGEATITIGAHKASSLAAGKFFKKATFTVTVEDAFAIVDVKANQANELEVTFPSAVDATLSVVKGTNAVDATVVWNADKTVATIKTTAKMTAGTYTVKAVSGEATAEKSVEIENQKVDKIVILNDVALTGKDSDEAYIYYSVVDQYGADLTASTSIQWSSSCDVAKVDRSEGRITLTRTDDKAFTYGEQIYLNGVYTKTGVVAQATVTVGSAQAVNSIDMVGFVKKNTTTLVQNLPNDFKSNEYYLVFDALDQNGNPLEASKEYAEDYDQITFISDNVMVVSEIKGGETTIVIDGHEYNAVFVQPGDFVSKGGEFNVTAIASNTGHKSMMNFVVGASQILDSFTMSTPTTLIADNESVEIPFVALDKDGEAITNFVTLADNLNKLSFSVSAGEVKLEAQNDGTAKLFYYDAGEVTWSDAAATDGIDRTVSITSVVVGGTSDNLMLYISDMARPDAIKKVKINPVLLEGHNQTITLKDFLFLDQYGRTIGLEMNLGVVAQDNGFFAASKAGQIKGIDFSGYTYDIKMEYKGSAAALVTGASVQISAASDSAILGAGVTFEADAKTKTALTGNNFEFAIAKKEAGKEYDNVSTTYNHTFSVVDIAQVKNFAVADLALQYVETAASTAATGELAGVNASNITGAAVGANIVSRYAQTVSVTGTYNGTTVTIPAKYFEVVGTKLQPAGGLNNDKIDTLSADAILWSDLYDATTAKYIRKNTNDTLKVSIYEIYDNAADTLGNVLGTPTFRDSVNKVVTISDAAPVLTNINLLDAKTVRATNTRIYASDVVEALKPSPYTEVYTDQYGKVATPTSVSYKISDVKEAAGYVENNFTVARNDDAAATITGAECGDTFTFTITATQGNVTVIKVATITVGADTKAVLTDSVNEYTDGHYDATLEDLKDYLENQRQEILK